MKLNHDLREEARGHYLDDHGPAARRRHAAERQELRDRRTPEEQLALLATRRGNSACERERLEKQIVAAQATARAAAAEKPIKLRKK